jgi:succinoglycan biosynthesis protein ExoV
MRRDVPMKIFYHQCATPNVGDDINAHLWPAILGDALDASPYDWMVGIGTILDERILQLDGAILVAGAGVRPGKRRLELPSRVTICAVRGRLSAANLGLSDEQIGCDPGFFVRNLGFAKRTTPGRTGFVPHIYSEQGTTIAATARKAGFHVISPTLDHRAFLTELLTCERVFTESLHGAIFADAFRIPWARVKVSSHYREREAVSDFKWADAFQHLACATTAVNSRPRARERGDLRPLRPLLGWFYALTERRLIAELSKQAGDPATFRLSDEALLTARMRRFEARLATMLRQPR